METERAAGRIQRGSVSARPIQPLVSPVELVEFARSSAAERLARLEADTALMMQLSAEGFNGKAWRKLSHALVEYGFTVMRAWIISGRVFGKLREKGRGGMTSPAMGIPRDEALMLADDTVANAIVDFRDRVLKTGFWDPSKGASLTTFFVGNCLQLQFPNVYRKWLADRKHRLMSTPLDTIDLDAADALSSSSSDSPEHEVVSGDASARAVRNILAPVGEATTRTILLLRSEGFGIDEIAEIVGLSYKQVESRLYRGREAVRRALGERS